MGYPKWFEDIVGITVLRGQVADMNSKFVSRTTQYNNCETDKLTINSRLQTEEAQLTDMTIKLSKSELSVGDLKTQLVNQAAVSNALMADKASLIDQVKNLQADGSSLFRNPTASLVVVEDPTHVMLGTFIQWTKDKGFFNINFPNHPAVFQPCPWMEEMLDLADCNRRRGDLTEIQVCEKIANAYHRTIRYKYDSDQWGRADNWTLAVLVKPLGGDDCESSAQAICSAILYYQQKFGVFQNLIVYHALGHIKGAGHGFVLVAHKTSMDLKDSYILEPTLQFESSAMPLIDASKDYDADWGIIGWPTSTNPNGTYEIKNKWWMIDGKTFYIANARGGSVDLKEVAKKVMVKLGMEPSDEQKKMKMIEGMWRNYKR